jgi:hypothetical protein
MYLVVRTWTNAGVLADAMQARTQEVIDLLSGVPGFQSYYATRDGDTLTTITICESREGTQESTRRAGEWAKQNMAGTTVGAPTIAEGQTFVHF